MLTEIFWTAVTSILTEILWALLFIACFAFLLCSAEGDERRRKEAEEYQKAVDRRRKEATAELERQMPGDSFAAWTSVA